MCEKKQNITLKLDNIQECKIKKKAKNLKTKKISTLIIQEKEDTHILKPTISSSSKHNPPLSKLKIKTANTTNKTVNLSSNLQVVNSIKSTNTSAEKMPITNLNVKSKKKKNKHKEQVVKKEIHKNTNQKKSDLVKLAQLLSKSSTKNTKSNLNKMFK